MSSPADARTAGRLITVAHGTRNVEANTVARAITSLASRRLGVPATASYVELCEPTFTSVMARNRDPAVVVPLLLSTGYHIRVDLPRAAAASEAPIRLARAAGPHPLLAEVMCLRLRAARTPLGSPVVLVAAGSNDPRARADLDAATRLLAGRWGGPVELATLGGQHGPQVADAVAKLGARPDSITLAPYLLAEGHFSSRMNAIARVLRVRTADVLGPHPLIAELVCRRYRALAAGARAA